MDVTRSSKLRWIVVAAQVALALIYVIPFYWMFVKSFSDDIFPNLPADLIPKVQTLGNYLYVWHFGDFPVWYLNSVVIALAVTGGNVLLGSLAGYAFARLRFPGRDVLFYLVLATLMVPFPLVMISEYILMVNIGWVNSYQGVVVPSLTSALSVFLMRQYFTTLPTELEDAARLDGLSTFQIFYKVAAPLARPAMAATAIFSFIGAWNSFLWPLLVLQSQHMFTLPLAINFFKGANGTQIYWNQMTAAEVLSMIPTLLIYAVFERYFTQGIALTGIKR
ncbi:sugar ABC transporter permease [Sulfodiicoccus acidiphilus]|uniref:Sugar ABC transporter permease n=1 Tax=Sulfodiicoccus acidiphilus TaxID=1670455 RepID=A0A348B5J0_9CREN|nr:carbohydrate ABC transporter permease [Sulfodiicoccus acidiphilus]BBD73442.1 sugar ABC transporter permease [Sulfodiicoccus acidiphilus]GGT98511.1 sugar ABC transporter permease [Sulfodiicoccus acidiphilus]